MGSLVVPKTGLALVGANDANMGTSKTGSRSTQVMQMILSEDLLEELVKSNRSGGKGMHLSFGKTPVCCQMQYPYIMSLYC